MKEPRPGCGANTKDDTKLDPPAYRPTETALVKTDFVGHLTLKARSVKEVVSSKLPISSPGTQNKFPQFVR